MNEPKKTSLWTLGLGPLLWAMHFLFAYIFSAIWCAKFGRLSELSLVRVSIFFATLITLIIMGIEIFKSFKTHRMGNSRPPHNADTPEDRERFLGWARFLISSLSFLAILYTTYVGWFFRSCL